MDDAARDRERALEELRLRLLNQLDQRVGREKAVLRRTIAVLTRRTRRSGRARQSGRARRVRGDHIPSRR